MCLNGPAGGLGHHCTKYESLHDLSRCCALGFFDGGGVMCGLHLSGGSPQPNLQRDCVEWIVLRHLPQGLELYFSHRTDLGKSIEFRHRVLRRLRYELH